MKQHPKLEDMLATVDEKEATVQAQLSMTQKIVSELVRARRHKAPADTPADERLSVTETVVAELIAEALDDLRQSMAEARDQIRKIVDKRS
jgi:hypothetical protein